MAKKQFDMKKFSFLHVEATKWFSLVGIMKFSLLLVSSVEEYVHPTLKYSNKSSVILLIVFLSLLLAFSTFLFFHSFRHSFQRRHKNKKFIRK